VREVFDEFGEIVEVVILRDRRTNMHQGCCFVKFSSLIAAQAAINALHNQRSLPPLRNPLQVRFADSANSADRGQTNSENKLFVGGVPSGCGDKELRTLFNTYGEVLDVYILGSKNSQEGQRGCAFVRYASPHSCAMAIEALHGKYAMKAGELPLVVRYADPPKSQRGGAASSSYGPTGRGSFPGWPTSPPTWPSGPPMGWPMHPYGMPGGAMPGYPPWVMPPGVGQPGVPHPYGYYGQQYGSQQTGSQTPASPAPRTIPPPPQYCSPPPPPPPSGVGAGVAAAMPPPPPLTPVGAWTEHLTPEGLRYYYNTQTGTSSWEMPPEMQVKQQLQLQQRQVHHPAQHSHPQQVPPLPPLPQTVNAVASQGGGLDKSMEALSISSNGVVGYTQPASSPMSATGGLLPHASTGLGSIGGNISTLTGLSAMPPQNGGHDGGAENGATVVSGGGEQQWWPGGEQQVNVQ